MKLIKLMTYKGFEITLHRCTDLAVKQHFTVTVTRGAWTQDNKRELIFTADKQPGPPSDILNAAKERVDSIIALRGVYNELSNAKRRERS
jgi:hypothetical protein